MVANILDKEILNIWKSDKSNVEKIEELDKLGFTLSAFIEVIQQTIEELEQSKW